MSLNSFYVFFFLQLNWKLECVDWLTGPETKTTVNQCHVQKPSEQTKHVWTWTSCFLFTFLPRLTFSTLSHRLGKYSMYNPVKCTNLDLTRKTKAAASGLSSMATDARFPPCKTHSLEQRRKCVYWQRCIDHQWQPLIMMDVFAFPSEPGPLHHIC